MSQWCFKKTIIKANTKDSYEKQTIVASQLYGVMMLLLSCNNNSLLPSYV